MSIAELKTEVDRLSPELRRQLTAYLVAQDRLQDSEFRRELTAKIDDSTPGNWVSLEDAEKQMGN